MKPAQVYLNQLGVVSPLGAGVAQHEQVLFSEHCDAADFLTLSDSYSPGTELPLGRVSTALPTVSQAAEQSRNNQLISAALNPLLPDIERLKSEYGAHRIGVVVGTSTSGIEDGEAAIKHYQQHDALPDSYHYRLQEPFAPARFISAWLGTTGPTWAVSSACTSGGKALVSAARLIESGVCDAVIAGGADSLCRMTVAGFASLGVISSERCRPFSGQRAGINIGEAAAFFILSRVPGEVALLGSAETSDAHHISAPDPSGAGAETAMRKAIAAAKLQPADISYINFHGTATAQNDKMEAEATSRVFTDAVACGSTKALTGHTLGAAGALEAAFCWLSLRRPDGAIPHHCWDGHVDPELPALPGLNSRALAHPMKAALSNSFAFGGNNVSLVLVAC